MPRQHRRWLLDSARWWSNHDDGLEPALDAASSRRVDHELLIACCLGEQR